ncbi:hypothetical protein V5O48_017243 [Marasmius crinis-equi]|uniref:DUF6535 domain-containing protein n=1 Tax=Marasmius crinis-equi TaxID=585013 RepID=A0ABR3EPN4_9AGAR
MTSEPPTNDSSKNTNASWVSRGSADGPSKDRSRTGDSLSEEFKDVGASESAKKLPLGSENPPSDGSGKTPQATAGVGKDTGPVQPSGLGTRNEREGVKRAESVMDAKGADNLLDESLNKDEKGGPDPDASPPLAASKPSVDESWRVVMKEVVGIDDEQFTGWKDDIDTLLVFAGLFSAVVTAFVIESYQWLSEDPQDTAVTLLRQISQQISNGSIAGIEHEPNFKASPSDVRINAFWFLSLIIALVDALFGLLCKQWLREHRRPTHTRTPEEALALHWLRRESLEIWHVPTFVAALPMLLELALFLFFAGLLELLWTRHVIPFSVAIIVIGSAVLVYVGTTMIPSIDIIRQALQVTPNFRWARTGGSILSPVDLISTVPPMEFACPYKSPQAWVILKAARAISRISHDIMQYLWYHHILISWKDLVFPDWYELADVWRKLWTELKKDDSAEIGFSFSFRTLDRILMDPDYKESGLELFKSCLEASRDLEWCSRYYPLPHNLAQHIIATTTPHQRTYGSPAVSGSPFVASKTCLALMQQIHGNLLTDRGGLHHSMRAYDWQEATDIIQHIHDLPVDHFLPLPGYFPIPLTKLKDLLWGLPDEPSDRDFEFLFSYQKHCPKNVLTREKVHFLEVLFDYIDEYPDLRVSHKKHHTDPPLLRHLKALEFFGFLFVHWEALCTEIPIAPDSEIEKSWMKVLERIRLANGWSPDELKAILTPLPDSCSESPPDHAAPQQIERAGKTAQADTGRVDGDSAVDCSNKDGGVRVETPSKKAAIEMVALTESPGGPGGGDVDHTSQGGRAISYGEDNDRNV